MPSMDYQVRVQPSLLDRLLDDEPEVAVEPLSQRLYSLQQLKHTLRRDLEALLNTRQAHLPELAGAGSEVQRSLLTYGLPDFTACSLLDPADQQRIRRALEQALVTCEPRLRRVHVTLEPPRPPERVLRFRIEAFLYIEPAPEPVTFDAMLQLHTLQYVVRG